MTLAFSGDLTKSTATPEYPLGYRASVPAANRALGAMFQTADQGEKEFVYVLNNSGADLIVGDLIAREAQGAAPADPTYYNVRQSPGNAPLATLVGVAVVAIRDGKYGWVQCKGQCLVNMANADLRDAALVTGGAVGRAFGPAGAASDAVQGVIGLGGFDNTPGPAGALGSAWINCPYA